MVLGKKRVLAKCNNKKRIVEKDEAFYYVSILKTIEVQLSGSREILDMVIGGPLLAREEGVMEGVLCQWHICSCPPSFFHR